MFGLLDMICLKNLERKDILMFTYCGDGRFDIVVFDKSKVEKFYKDSEAVTCIIFTSYIISIIMSLS